MSVGPAAPGDSLTALAISARESLVLVAPFIKAGALSRLLDHVRVPSLTCVTRWLPGEIAAGVSDLAAYEIVKAAGGNLILRQDLHAKYYRGDSRVLVGSANITLAALGWSAQPNLELLVEHKMADLLEFEREVLRDGIRVDDEMHAMLSQALGGLSLSPEPCEQYANLTLGRPVIDVGRWLPSLRHPAELFRTYTNPEDDKIASIARSAALADLSVLRPPAGLSESVFDGVIAAVLRTLPLIKAVDHYVETPRPFGAVRELLQRHLGCDRDVAEGSLQTLIRWLWHFDPDRYEYRRPGHSEILGRRH